MKELKSRLLLFFVMFLLIASILPNSPFTINTVEAAPVYPTFGIKTAYTTTGDIDYIRYFSVTNCTGSGAVKTLSAYVIATWPKLVKVKCALYQWVSNTNVGNLLATCAEQTFTGTGDWAWRTFTFNTSYNVVAGTKYVLAIWSNSTYAYVGYAAGNGGYVNLAYDSWPSPITIELDQSRNYSMYVSYTRAPTQSTPSPANASTGIQTAPLCSITVADIDADSMTVKFYENSTGSYVLRQTNTSVTNGTYRWTYSQATSLLTKYYWRVDVIEGTYYNVSAWYKFTTYNNHAPTIACIGPGNNTINIARWNRTSLTVTDVDADATTVCFWNNKTGSYVKYQQNNTVASGTIIRCMNSTFANAYNTKYWWKVTANDGYINSSAVFIFTTINAAGPWGGPDYYINVSIGGDGNNGSLMAPWLTLEHAVASTDSGDTIYLMKGTYTPTTYIDIDTKGAVGNWYTIRNYASDLVVINGVNCPKSNWLRAVLDFTDCNYVRVSGLTINHSGRGAITFRTAGTHYIIDNCSLMNSAQHAIKFYHNINNITIEHNDIYNNFNNWSGILNSDDEGLSEEVVSLTGMTYDLNINNNTFIYNHWINIDVKGGVSRARICHNRINTTSGYVQVYPATPAYGEAGIYLDTNAGTSKNVSIYNNLIYGNNTGINLNCEGNTGHFEYTYIYNNVINMTRGHFGNIAGFGTPRCAIYFGNEGNTHPSYDLFHHIYIYNNMLRTGVDSVRDYPIIQIGATVGAGPTAQFTTSNLANFYIINNIFYTGDTGASYYMMTVRNITWAQASGIFTFNNNSFFRSSGNINIYWGSTVYTSATPVYFGGQAMFSDPKFLSNIDEYGNFHIPITSICRDTGSNIIKPSVDFDGVARPHNTYYDIGAYEYDGSLQVCPGDTFNCDNEYYSTLNCILFNSIILDNHWIQFNGIGFNTTAPNPVYINFSNIKSQPKNTTGYIMNFTETHVAGATQYIINGLKTSHNYTIITNGTDYSQTTSITGALYLNQTGSSRNHKLYDPGIPSSGIFVSVGWGTIPAGSDTTGDGSIGNPYKTLRKALNVSTTGDTIQIRGGDYTQPGWTYVGAANHGLTINRDDITINGYNGEKVVIDGSAVTFTVGYGIFMIYSGANYYHNITINNINISNSSYNGITGGASAGEQNDYITITNCSFYNIYNRAINMPGISGVTIDNLRVANCFFNWIQNNATMNECVSISGNRNFIFENNTIRNFVKQFLSISGGCASGKIRYNSFGNKWYYSIKFDSQNNCNNTIYNIDIYNNLFFGTAPASVTHYPISIYINPEAVADGGTIHNVNIYNNIFNISTSAAAFQCQGININLGLVTTYTISNMIIKYNTIYTKGSSASSYPLRVTKGTGTISSSVIANNVLCTDESSPNYQVSFVDLPSTQTSFTITNNQYYNFDGVTSGIDYSAGADGFGTNGWSNNTQFVSRAAMNFHLNTTSPCIDHASSTYTVSNDYERNSRPQFTGYDRGAYEYTTGLPPSPSFLFTSESPTNNSIGLALTPTVSIHIHETHGYKFNYTIRENHTVPGVWTLLDSANNQNNGTYTHIYHPATDYGTIYGWKITAVNGTTWHNETYYFITTTPVIPAFLFSAVTPVNSSIGNALIPTAQVTVAETHGFLFNFTFQENSSGTWTTTFSNNNVGNSTIGFGYMNANAYSTKYYWRLAVVNGTTYHNATYHFTTLATPAPSTDITIHTVHANWTTSTSIYISWVKGSGTTHSYLYRSTTGYMIGAANIYANIGTSYNDTPLNPNQRYYYTLKPFNATTTTWGQSLNISLVETDNTSTTTSASALFKGWLATDKNMKANYHYSSSQDFGTTTLNITSLSDYYNGTSPYSHEDSYYGLYLFGQTFRTGTDRIYLYNISIHGYRSGTPLTILNMRLYDANATGKPSGAILATGTKDITGITTSSTGEWITTEMPSYYLKSRTTYAFICYIPGGSGSLLVLQGDNTAPMYSEGCLTESGDGGATYTNTTTEDALFRINGKTPMTYPAGGLITTNSTMTTTSLYDILKNNLVSGWMYYYYATANDTKGNLTKGNMRYTLTNPDAPVFLNILPSFTNNSVKITWIPGGGANRTIIRESNIAYPSLVTDGALSYNDTGSLCWVHNISFNMTYYFSLFSFSSWGSLSRFSSGVHIPWGGVTFIVYNESKPWQVINASMIVTDSEGLHPVQFNNIYGYYSFNISQIPYGENTLFYVSNSSYHSRLYPITIIPNIFYNFSFYLPPIISPIEGPPGSNVTCSYMIQITTTLSGESYEQILPVSGALVKFYRYFNTTANYTYIGGFVTDGNGQGGIDLYPYQLYMIKISCSGYDDKTDWWTPNVVEQGLIKGFKIIASSVVPPVTEYTDFWTTIVFTATMNNTNVTSVHYYDVSGHTINTQLYLYEFYNDSTTFVASDTRIGDNSFYWNVSLLNYSRTYIVVLRFNSTNDFNIPDNRVEITIFPLYPIGGFDLEKRITDVFGDFKIDGVIYSWVGFFLSIIPLMILALFDPAHVGIGIIATGFFMAGVQGVMAMKMGLTVVPPLLIVVIPVIIVIGVLYMLAQRNGWL
jgi:hypothetical protein